LFNSNKPVISVIVLSKSGGKHLTHLLKLLARQKIDLPFETIVVLEKGATPPEAHTPIKQIVVKAGLGIAQNRNIGIEAAQGEAIAFIDDDCLPRAHWLVRLTKPLFQGDEVTTSGFSVLPSTKLGNAIATLGFPGGGSLGFEKMWPVTKDSFTSHLGGGNCAFKKQVLQEVGGFLDELVFGGEDTELALRLIKAGHKIRYVADALVWHQARKRIREYLRWQFRRGRANYLLIKNNQQAKQLVSKRLSSFKQVLLTAFKRRQLLLVTALLIIGLFTQVTGYFWQVVLTKCQFSKFFKVVSKERCPD
jgi:GT2 family glycosyltransferase